jgi:hypothetical protein
LEFRVVLIVKSGKIRKCFSPATATRPRLSAHDPFTNPNLNVHKNDWSVDPAAVGRFIGRVRQAAKQ